jgi:hypothetical protein
MTSTVLPSTRWQPRRRLRRALPSCWVWWWDGLPVDLRERRPDGRRVLVAAQELSLPGGDYQPLCVAQLPIPAQFPRGRRDVSYETIRGWCQKFGQTYANGLRRRRPHPGDKWHLDEVFIKIHGETHYLWRAVDQHGTVLDILVQSRRHAQAAKKFFRRLLTGLRAAPSLSGSFDTPWCQRFTAGGVIGDSGVCVNGGASR